MKLTHCTWGRHSVAMPYHCYIIWLINGDPKFDFVAKTAKNEVSVIFESVDNSVVLPATNILQSLWKIPVVESDLTQIRKNKFPELFYFEV